MSHNSSIFDFDTVIDRRNTASLKWDKYIGRDILPLWVADMDFKSPPAVLKALQDRIEHGIFGYAQAHEGLNDAIDLYLAAQRGAKVPREQILHLGGLVPALSLAGLCSDQLAPPFPPLGDSDRQELHHRLTSLSLLP